MTIKITFESENYKFEGQAEDFEDLYHVLQSGLLAMTYHPNTVKDLFSRDCECQKYNH